MAARAAAEKADSIEPGEMASALETIASSKDVPGYIGPDGLFEADGPLAHVIHTQPSDMVFVEAAPTVDGQMPGPVVGAAAE